MQWGTGRSSLNLGVIQQLRGPNFTQFWPTSPLECSCNQAWTFYWPTIHLIFSTWLLKDPFSCLYPINYLFWCYKISPKCLNGWARIPCLLSMKLVEHSFWKGDFLTGIFVLTTCLGTIQVLRQHVFSFFKGQLISKCLFCVFNFSQKTKQNKSTWGIIVV